VAAMKVVLDYESSAAARRLGGVSRRRIYITMCNDINLFYLVSQN